MLFRAFLKAHWSSSACLLPEIVTCRGPRVGAGAGTAPQASTDGAQRLVTVAPELAQPSQGSPAGYWSEGRGRRFRLRPHPQERTRWTPRAHRWHPRARSGTRAFSVRHGDPAVPRGVRPLAATGSALDEQGAGRERPHEGCVTVAL